MKAIKITAFLLILTVLLPVVSCESLDTMNEDPNNPEKVAPNYILTYALVEMTKGYRSKGDDNIACLLQYMQRGTTYYVDRLNHYNWTAEGWSNWYEILRNVKLMHESALKDGNKMLEGMSLALQANVFGIITDLWGDCPYSESLKANEGIFFPKYDAQIDVYKGVLADLKSADQVFSASDIGEYNIGNADVLYGGDAVKWKKFVNSLRLRYCMRLIEKRAEMSSAGVDIVAEFNDAAGKAFTSNSDDAFLPYLGTTKENSYPYGPINSVTAGILSHNTKPAKTIVDYLKAINDPRLYRLFKPVETKWDFDISEETTKTFTNMFGDTYSVIWLPTTDHNLDTSLYVGLPIGMQGADAIRYNSAGMTFIGEERSPFISNLHERFFQNAGTYVRMDIFGYAEVEFLLAEAAERGGFAVTGAETHFSNAIKASMSRWGIQDGANGFDFNAYYANPDVSYAAAGNKIERIMQQKWIALWYMPEPWFDWRRTGYPDLRVGENTFYGVPFANTLPLRFQYPTPNQDPRYLINYNEAVGKLEKTSYVPASQSADIHYSKMWLLQGTGKPY